MDHYPAQSAPAQDGRPTDGAGGVPERAADAAASVKDSGAQVADTAKERLGDVVSETKDQAANLAGDVRQRLTDEARKQSGRAGEVLHGWADDLGAMAEKSEQDSPARSAVVQLSQQGKRLAERLGGENPEGVLDDVRAFARRRPAAFLLGSALAGFAVGRLAKGLGASGGGAVESTLATTPETAPVRPSAPAYDTVPGVTAPEIAPLAGEGAYAPPAPTAPYVPTREPAVAPVVPPQSTVPATGSEWRGP